MGKLSFLGRGSAFNVKEGNTSAFVKNENAILLIDCGENIFERIILKNLLDNVEDVFILITHLHPDHVGSLGSLIFYCYYMKNIRLNILYEDTYSLTRLLKLQGASTSQFNIFSSKEAMNLNKFGITKIEAIETEHTPEIESFGYKIDFSEGLRILYLGDINSINNCIIQEIKDGYYSEVYLDTCLKDFKHNPHLSIDRLSKLVPKDIRAKVYCMHYDSDDLIPKIIGEGFNAVEVI